MVLEGESQADEAVITGESGRSRNDRRVRDRGQYQYRRSLLIESSGAGNQTRWAQIWSMVRDALIRRSPTQPHGRPRARGFRARLAWLGNRDSLLLVRVWPFDQALLAGSLCSWSACPCAVGLACAARDLGSVSGSSRGAVVSSAARRPRGARPRAPARLRQDRHAHRRKAHWPHRESEGVEDDEVLARPPVWSSIPSMASRALSRRQRPRAVSNRLPHAMSG